MNNVVREYQILAASNALDREKKTETMAAIVLSYNRPRMLKEALQSLHGVDQIIITDDGSDFQPMDVVKELGLKNTSIISSPQASFDERTKKPRLGKMINYALQKLVETSLVTYLCDDDLFDKDWLNIVKTWMYDRPACHIVKGNCKYFKDGEDISQAQEAWLGGRGLTSGNFVHRMDCIHEEQVTWPEHKLTSIDDGFLWELYKHHNTWMIPYINHTALYRRVHDNALSNFSYGYEMTVDGENKLRAKVGDGFSKEGKEELDKKIWME